MSEITTANAVYLKPAVSTVNEAIERQEEISKYIETTSASGAKDGVACFNYLYTVITKRVRDGIDDGFFQDRAFLTQLDVVFANRYFDALRASVVDPPTTPRVWDALFECRDNQQIESIQFAVAGVNAHVNFDLALSVIETCKALRTEPNSGTQRADYEKINQIFSDEMATLRQHYIDGLAKEIDKAASPVLNIISDWSIDAARDAAWEIAETFWTLSRFGINETPLIRRLDRLTALSGKLLLTPVV